MSIVWRAQARRHASHGRKKSELTRNIGRNAAINWELNFDVDLTVERCVRNRGVSISLRPDRGIERTMWSYFPRADQPSGIRISGKYRGRMRNPDAYEAAVRTVLSNVRRTRTGGALIQLLLNNRHWFAIVPQARGQRPTTGPLAASDLLARVIVQDATRRGERARNGHGPDAGDLIDPARSGGTVADWTGTGIGTSHVGVRFSPERYRHTSSAETDQRTVLAHELVHAFRMMTGQSLAVRMPDRPGTADDDEDASYYSTEEEFYAVLVANIMASEIGLTLKIGYSSFDRRSDEYMCRDAAPRSPAPPERPSRPGALTMRSGGSSPTQCFGAASVRVFTHEQLEDFSRYYARRFADLLSAFRRQNRLLFNRICAIPWHVAPFNPLRATDPSSS